MEHSWILIVAMPETSPLRSIVLGTVAKHLRRGFQASIPSESRYNAV